MGGTFETAAGGTFETDMPGTFHSATGGTFVPVLGGTFNPLLSQKGLIVIRLFVGILHLLSNTWEIITLYNEPENYILIPKDD